MNKLSKASREKLDTCHRDLQTIILTALAHSDIDFGVSEGNRSTERQYKLYKEGRSQIDGIEKMGSHNYNPSKAVDIFAYVGGKANYDAWNMCYLAGVILSTAKRLYDAGVVKHRIRWGGVLGSLG